MLLNEMPEKWQKLSIKALSIAFDSFDKSPIEVAAENGPLEQLYNLWKMAHASEESIWGSLYRNQENRSKIPQACGGKKSPTSKPYKDLARFYTAYGSQMSKTYRGKDEENYSAQELITNMCYPGVIVCPEQYAHTMIIMVEGAIYKDDLESAFAEAALLKGDQLNKEDRFPAFLVGDDFEKWTFGEVDSSVFRKQDKRYAQFIAHFSRICSSSSINTAAYDEIYDESYAILKNSLITNHSANDQTKIADAIASVKKDMWFSREWKKDKAKSRKDNERIRAYIRRIAFSNTNKRCGFRNNCDPKEISGYSERYAYFTLSEIALMKPKTIICVGNNSVYTELKDWCKKEFLSQTAEKGAFLFPSNIRDYFENITLIKTYHPSWKWPKNYLADLTVDNPKDRSINN